MKKLMLALIFCIGAVFMSCKHDEFDVSICTEVSFDSNRISVPEGSEVEVKAVLNPAGCEAFNNVNYRIVNEKIAEIVYSDGREIRIKGKKSGATVLVCECGGTEGKAIVSVSSETSQEGARSVLPSSSSYYLYTITYEVSDGFETTSFIKESGNDIEVYDGSLVIERENGILFKTSLKDLIDIRIDRI